MNRVVVTGAGVVSPLGDNADVFFEALIAGRSGIRALGQTWGSALRSPYAGIVVDEPDVKVMKTKRIGFDRVAVFALSAARQAAAASGLSFDGESGESAGVFWGTGMGGAVALEAAYRELLEKKATRIRPSTVVSVMNNSATGQIAIDLGIRGPSNTYSTACSSSAIAIGEGFRAIRHGHVRTALAGGGDALLTYGVLKAWESIGTLARIDPAQPQTSIRPFAADRSGFLLAEGAAALMLENEADARARGAVILAEIVGYGNSTDAGHITHPDAQGQARAIRLALAEAGIAPRQVGHINAHGTGTRVGDLAETTAIKAVFGAHAGLIPISATKALHGHLMGATGALEFIAAIQSMRTGIAPPTAHLWQPDPECDLDYVPLHARSMASVEYVMANSFGFGGSNAVLVARRHG